ncbi:hypothetical protein BC829DRAFT_388670 [Chytridium lagenaria]|nr:hypothetical protein BC829DRAFT_388670 [Chytridium lagenaria]
MRMPSCRSMRGTLSSSLHQSTFRHPTTPPLPPAKASQRPSASRILSPLHPLPPSLHTTPSPHPPPQFVHPPSNLPAISKAWSPCLPPVYPSQPPPPIPKSRPSSTPHPMSQPSLHHDLTSPSRSTIYGTRKNELILILGMNPSRMTSRQMCCRP